jgi:hypothetical protein
MSQENQSIASHQGNLVNSISVIPSQLRASRPFSACNFCVPNESLNAALESGDLNPLTNAVIKIKEILNAATVTTGAKTIPMIALRLRYLSNHSILMKFLKLSLRTINGEATIYNRRIPILAINTTANAISGKNNAIATQVLMINIPEVSQMLETLLSESCAKLSKEA